MHRYVCEQLPRAVVPISLIVTKLGQSYLWPQETRWLNFRSRSRSEGRYALYRALLVCYANSHFQAPLGSCLSGGKAVYKGLLASIRVHWHRWGEVMRCVAEWTWVTCHTVLLNHVSPRKQDVHCTARRGMWCITFVMVIVVISFTFINTKFENRHIKKDSIVKRVE